MKLKVVVTAILGFSRRRRRPGLMVLVLVMALLVAGAWSSWKYIFSVAVVVAAMVK